MVWIIRISVEAHKVPPEMHICFEKHFESGEREKRQSTCPLKAQRMLPCHTDFKIADLGLDIEPVRPSETKSYGLFPFLSHLG